MCECVSQELESEEQYRQAEHHFVEGGDWKAAVNMHRAKNMWDDAYRVSITALQCIVYEIMFCELMAPGC